MNEWPCTYPRFEWIWTAKLQSLDNVGLIRGDDAHQRLDQLIEDLRDIGSSSPSTNYSPFCSPVSSFVWSILKTNQQKSKITHKEEVSSASKEFNGPCPNRKTNRISWRWIQSISNCPLEQPAPQHPRFGAHHAAAPERASTGAGRAAAHADRAAVHAGRTRTGRLHFTWQLEALPFIPMSLCCCRTQQVRRCLRRLHQKLLYAEEELTVGRQSLLQASISK